jgi:hypothetical protein
MDQVHSTTEQHVKGKHYNGPIGLDRYSENYREHGRIAVEERSICHGTKDELQPRF